MISPHVRRRGSGRSSGRRVVEVGYRAEHFAPITENDTQFLQVLIGQVGKNREINAVFSKTLSVLGRAELSEPVRNLLQRRGPRRSSSELLRRSLSVVAR
jgi:hypothetical protein